MDGSTARWRVWWPVVATLIVVVLLGYPLALLFGLPLARRDMVDLRKWIKETVVAQAPLVPDGATLHYNAAPAAGALIWRQALIGRAQVDPGTERVPVPNGFDAPVTIGPPFERLGPVLFRGATPLAADEAGTAIYTAGRLQLQGSVLALQRPDGQATRYTFGNAGGPVFIDVRPLEEGTDYVVDGDEVVFAEAPPFGSQIRRVSSDYAVVDGSSGLVLFASPPEGNVVLAGSAVRLAEVLAGEANGTNLRFRFARANILDGDGRRRVFVEDRFLNPVAERAEERVDGERATFTFESDAGIVAVDGVPSTEGRDFARAGRRVTFAQPPPRNARLRQHPDYILVDPEGGEILVAAAPTAGELVWTDRYTFYAEPSCGKTLMACFFALPQHPVPFPHWIAERVGPFFGKFALTDERNVVRATLYTTLGTLSALVLGGAIGILLAVVFVLLRPIERALLPWVIASQTVPIIALVPVLLLVLGNFGITIQTSLLPTAIIGGYITFFPVVVGTVKGLRSVDPLALDLMRSYAASSAQVFVKVRFPAAVPFFFTSLKLGTAAALVGALVAETESNNRRGLGFQILGQVQSGNVADVWILLIISGILGIGLVALIGLLERLLAPWRRRA